jgi:hypothetical protein
MVRRHDPRSAGASPRHRAAARNAQQRGNPFMTALPSDSATRRSSARSPDVPGLVTPHYSKEDC